MYTPASIWGLSTGVLLSYSEVKCGTINKLQANFLRQWHMHRSIMTYILHGRKWEIVHEVLPLGNGKLFISVGLSKTVFFRYWFGEMVG